MCLAIPGQVVELVDETNRLAKVDVAGVVRNVNVGLLDQDGDSAAPGDWVLIHVGFALSKVDEEEAQGDAPTPAGDGRGLRAGARGAEGERDRVTSACGDDGHCITCSDEGIPMQVVEAPTAALALCAGADGARSEVMTDLVGEVAPGDRVLVHAGVALSEARMKYVDEYRDAELGRALAAQILVDRRARPPLQGHGGVRRPHAHDLQVRRRRPPPRERRARPRPRLSRLRDPDGPRRRRHRGRQASRA